MVLEERIKKYMDDIIDVAFADASDEKRKKYKQYTLNVLTKELKGSSGCYHLKERLIEIFNMSLGTDHVAKCCLHELAHHIDNMDNGTTNHGKAFYAAYAKLIYASLDMGILTKDVFYNENWSRDQNKVKRLVDKYEPHPVAYNKDPRSYIKVYNAFQFKDELKKYGFRWNKPEQVWEREYEQENGEAIVHFLRSKGLAMTDSDKLPHYSITNGDGGMYIDPIVYIRADGDTYNNREKLKSEKFYWDGMQKTWLKKVRAGEKDAAIKKYNMEFPRIRFSLYMRRD